MWVARKALGKKGSKFVAIKLIADHYVGDERYARMFRAEAELAAVLSHANIVQVFDEGEEDGRSYLIMEWVDGLNLLKLGDMLALLDDDQRRFRVTAYIIGQLLHALHYAHSITSHDGSPLGVVHRDVSPQNVLVSNHGEVKLTDFGVAYHNLEESSGIHVKGKVRYMSPEQLGGKTRSPTVDLFAVGALLHELLDGRRFRGEYEDGQDLFTVVFSGQVGSLSRPAPPELDRLRLGLLEADPSQRIQTAEQAVTLLKRYPGYGDARDELTKLCGSLTGVVRPRVGPGQSSQVAAADQATTRWGGRKSLAKPKVGGAGMRPPPAPPPARARAAEAASRSTGVTTVKHGKRSLAAAHDPAEALITGRTEIVRSQDVAGLMASADAMLSTIAPTTPLRAAGLRMLAVPANDPGPAAAGGYGAGAPAHVPGAASQPLAVQPAGAWGGAPEVPPTERLASESSGAAHPNNTEMLEANQIIEVSSSNETDNGIFPARPVREGTDTRRERAMAPTHGNSVSIVMRKRSAVAAVGAGLVLVAAMSVTVTWLLFTRGREDASVREGGSAVMAAGLATPPPKAERSVQPADAGADDAAKLEAGATKGTAGNAAIGGAPTDAATKGAVGDGTASEGVQADEAAPEPVPGGGVPGEDGGGAAANPREPSAAVPSAADAEVKPNTATEATPVRPKAPPKPKVQKVVVRIGGSRGLEKAQMKIGSDTFGVDYSRELKVTAGKKTLKWRRSPSELWQSGGSWSFLPGKKVVIFITKDGPKARYVDG